MIEVECHLTLRAEDGSVVTIYQEDTVSGATLRDSVDQVVKKAAWRATSAFTYGRGDA